VDDDEVWRYLLRRRLEELTSARVIEAPEGETALQLLRARKPALLILDMVMPQMSGIEVLRELRREPVRDDLRILVVTSKELTAQERETIRQAGAEILPKKDTSHEELQVGLERALLDVGLLNLHEKGA
jgi:CheY-like chemotaxis protein